MEVGRGVTEFKSGQKVTTFVRIGPSMPYQEPTDLELLMVPLRNIFSLWRQLLGYLMLDGYRMSKRQLFLWHFALLAMPCTTKWIPVCLCLGRHRLRGQS
jgi:hypothetical protein